LPAAVEADRPAFGVGEADAIQRFKPHQLLLHSGLTPQSGGLAQRSRARHARRAEQRSWPPQARYSNQGPHRAEGPA
jgi:hypothetical protein